MRHPPRFNVRRVDASKLPQCSRCGQTVVMLADLRGVGRGLVELCGACDQDRPGRAGWINFLIEGRARNATQMTEEMTRLWQACVLDVLGSSPLGLPTTPPPTGEMWSGWTPQR